MTLTRAEHLQWCKDRALEYLNQGDLLNAVTSMTSDMSKHPETKISQFLSVLGMLEVLDKNADGVRRWILGFY